MLLVGLLARLVLDGATGSFLGGALARDFGIAVGVDQSARARFLLFLGEGAQHDAPTALRSGRPDRSGATIAGRSRRAAAAKLHRPPGRRRGGLGRLG